MRLLRAAWPAFASSCLIAWCASACGSSTGSNVSNGSGASNSTGNGTGTGATGTGTGATGTTSGGGPNFGNLGGDPSNSGGQPAVNNPCAGTLIQAQRIPLDMYVMLDVSGSMLLPTEGDANVTKWQAVSSAISDFVSDPASDGIGVGLQVFPVAKAGVVTSCTADAECGKNGPCLNRYCWPLNNGAVDACLDDTFCGTAIVNNRLYQQACIPLGACANDTRYACDPSATATCSAGRGACAVPPSVCVSAADCRVATYASPAAEIAPLPGAKPGILKVIQASTPSDGALTPTGPALGGAVQKARAWATAHPDHQVVAVLATDGTPTLHTSGNLCAVNTTAADLQAVVTVAGNGKTGTPSIATFVIGVLGSEDPNAPAALTSIAKAGGSGDAFIVDTMGNVQMQFRDALNAIRASGLSCDLTVPMPEAGKMLDYGEVNVAFDAGSGPVVLDSVPSVADCAAHPRAWYYDVDPAQGMPTRIEACPGICADFKKTDMGSVQIELGCETHKVVVK